MDFLLTASRHRKAALRFPCKAVGRQHSGTNSYNTEHDAEIENRLGLLPQQHRRAAPPGDQTNDQTCGWPKKFLFGGGQLNDRARSDLVRAGRKLSVRNPRPDGEPDGRPAAGSAPSRHKVADPLWSFAAGRGIHPKPSRPARRSGHRAAVGQPHRLASSSRYDAPSGRGDGGMRCA